MSDRKRKAAICCLIAASIVAIENRKKRMLELRNECESKYPNSTTDPNNTSDYDQEGEEEDEGVEEENYETSNNLGIAIKVEPGLTDEDSVAECHTFKEEALDPLDTMIDIDSTTSIKQEKDYNYEGSSVGGIKIKVEPDSSDEDIDDVLSQNYAMDSSEGRSQSKEISFDDQTRIMKEDKEISNVDNGVRDPNDVRDDCQVFGDFVAGELRKLKSEDNRKKLKRIIQKVIIKISESDD